MEHSVETDKQTKGQLSVGKRIGVVAALTAWTGAGFFIGQLIIVALVLLLDFFDVFRGMSSSANVVLTTSVAAASYVMAFIVVACGMWAVTKHKPSLKMFGLDAWPRWRELGLGFITFFVYLIASGLFVALISEHISGFDANQVQDVGFDVLTSRYQYVLAFFTLVIIAPIAEEMLFRGFLYGSLRRYAPWWLSAIIVSLLFGAAHGQWNVAIDTAILSLFLCGLREIFGTIWGGVTVHMIKNGVAFYFLFVNPFILPSLSGLLF